MAEEFHGENRRNGDRFLFEQLSQFQKDFHKSLDDTERSLAKQLAEATRILAKEMNEQRDRHHLAINELGGKTLNQYMDVRDQLGELRQRMAGIEVKFDEHTHPEILLKQENIFKSLNNQLESIKTTLAVDEATEKGARKQRISTRELIAWVIAAIAGLLGALKIIFDLAGNP